MLFNSELDSFDLRNYNSSMNYLIQLFKYFMFLRFLQSVRIFHPFIRFVTSHYVKICFIILEN